ncbi:MAG: hypothetical protein CMB99_01180 [Flavobacteriaceae bacterium]|nr:hypothetical protein [Flavobacteriaceae bacterium]
MNGDAPDFNASDDEWAAARKGGPPVKEPSLPPAPGIGGMDDLQINELADALGDWSAMGLTSYDCAGLYHGGDVFVAGEERGRAGVL